jgi:hypothetical protein
VIAVVTEVAYPARLVPGENNFMAWLFIASNRAESIADFCRSGFSRDYDNVCYQHRG